jgi:hypothetical protein
VLRHLYAKQMLELLNSDVRVFNIDESWVNDLSWNQRQWHRRGSNNSVSSKIVSPRLSLIVAIDNFGSIYYSMTQVATDQDVFMLFLQHLTDKLTAESPNWPASTYFLMDGALYHKAKDTLTKMKALAMKTVIAGPYGWLGSPVELVFGYLKRVDLNVHNAKTGKK